MKGPFEPMPSDMGIPASSPSVHSFVLELWSPGHRLPDAYGCAPVVLAERVQDPSTAPKERPGFLVNVNEGVRRYSCNSATVGQFS